MKDYFVKGEKKVNGHLNVEDQEERGADFVLDHVVQGPGLCHRGQVSHVVADQHECYLVRELYKELAISDVGSLVSVKLNVDGMHQKEQWDLEVHREDYWNVYEKHLPHDVHRQIVDRVFVPGQVNVLSKDGELFLKLRITIPYFLSVFVDE